MRLPIEHDSLVILQFCTVCTNNEIYRLELERERGILVHVCLYGYMYT